jgi:hypothetical protein
MIDGMLAEPWHLRGYQEQRLREFLHLMLAARGRTTSFGREDDDLRASDAE